jgi:uncharacterized protein (DUF302 family)
VTPGTDLERLDFLMLALALWRSTVVVRNVLTSLAVVVLTAGLASAAKAEIVVKPSARSVEETVERIEAAAAAKGMMLFGRIDHAAGAAKAEMALPPMVLVQFGNPKAGTPLMQAAPAMGLSLPLKVLVWQGADGKVQIAYDPPADLAKLRNLAADHPALAKIAAMLDAITSEAVAP